MMTRLKCQYAFLSLILSSYLGCRFWNVHVQRDPDFVSQLCGQAGHFSFLFFIFSAYAVSCTLAGCMEREGGRE